MGGSMACELSNLRLAVKELRFGHSQRLSVMFCLRDNDEQPFQPRQQAPSWHQSRNVIPETFCFFHPAPGAPGAQLSNMLQHASSDCILHVSPPQL
jgi:hypothetical protein